MYQAVQADFAAMEDFFLSPAGLRLAKEINLELQASQIISPRHAVLNLCSGIQPTWPRQNNASYASVVTPRVKPHTDIQALPWQLPFANQRFDLVFAPFLWELVAEPKMIVDEIDRVLASMGQVVLVGFNPLGLWKLSRYLHTSKSKAWYQQTAGCSFWQVRRLFYQLDYEQVYARFFYYIPPVKNPFWLKGFNWFHHLSQLIAFYPSSCYLLVMKKRDPAWISPSLVKNMI
jgi:hypothetical protein